MHHLERRDVDDRGAELVEPGGLHDPPVIATGQPRTQPDPSRPGADPALDDRELLRAAAPDVEPQVLGRAHQPDAGVDVTVQPGQRVGHEQHAGHAATS